MNKNLKRIIALALVFGTVSAVSPVTKANLLVTKAYASTSSNSKEELDSLKLQDSSGSNIRLYDDDDYASSHKVDSDEVSDRDTYYAKTSSDTISIDTSGPSSRYVKIFKGTSSSTKGKSEGSSISLSSGTNTIVVKVYDSAPDSDVRYDDDSDVVSKYTIKVKRTTSDSTDSTTSNSTDAIYLNSLKINGVSVDLTKSKTSYDVTVKESMDEVTIKADPDDSDYDVAINGTSVNDDDDYEENVSLSKGKNTIKVKVDDDSKERVYTLNIYRGASSYTGDSSTTTNTATSNPSTATNVSTDTSAIKPNQWVQVNGGAWRYNDQYGNPLRNAWHYDTNYASMYYLDENCNMATGWKQINNIWYYFGDNGARRTSWQLVGDNWYYLDGEGKMVTGWIQDNGKYYYLNSNGTMAYNTKIGLYRLGSNGAWIGSN